MQITDIEHVEYDLITIDDDGVTKKYKRYEPDMWDRVWNRSQEAVEDWEQLERTYQQEMSDLARNEASKSGGE